MRTTSRAAKAAAIRRLMETEGAAVAHNTQGFNAGRYRSVARLGDYEGLKVRARQIKEDAIARVPELLGRLRAAVETHGGTVYLARDAADANRRILEMAGGARRLVKSKSMTSEEIGVNAALEAASVEVVETDLGEWVLQLAGERPSHIVAPAIHKSRREIARLFHRRFQPDEPLETAEALTRFARKKLGELIRGADVGLTGANFIAAETGTLCLITSEGNARKTAFVPPVYIAVAGVEKIIPHLEDLSPFIELIGRSGTGQDITSYVSLFTPPFDTPVPDFSRADVPLATGGRKGPERTFHLVLIDNGRLRMREDPQLKETLYCIRCSACANTCANFQHVGGHAFGGQTYSGGIATGWETGVHGLESAASFNDLCTGCSRCVPACPVGIDIPWINIVVRDRLNRQHEEAAYAWLARGLLPDEEPGRLDLQKRIFGSFDRLARLGSRTAPLSNWMTRVRPIRYAMEHFLGIDRRRRLPAFERMTLRKWFQRHSSRIQNASREVVLFCDAYTNYVHTERGKAAVRVLEALGANVHLSNTEDSGRAPLSQGMIATATEKARAVASDLAGYLEAGRDVVVVEPSDLAMFKRDYQRLLPETTCRKLKARSFEIMDYVGRIIADGADPNALRKTRGQKVAYHSHCQQRTLGLEAPTVALLRKLGHDVVASDVECCGMAGSFGYKTEYYELSMDVGERLRRQLGRAQDHTVVASGTSCQEQIEALLGRPVRHPVELIAPTSER